MAEDVKVPAVGPVKKKVVIPIVVVAGGFIAYSYWSARKNVGDGEPIEPGMDDESLVPSGGGAGSPTNSYGIPTSGGDTSTSGGGFRGTTNSEWTEYVTDRLQQSDQWSYTTIVVALGNFLNDRPLSQEQQNIAQAAIGVAGYPPVGTHVVVPGGNTPITVAPTGLRATATPTSASVTFSPVTGAATYNGYRTNSTGSWSSPMASAAGSPMVFAGLEPGKTYTIAVAAVSSTGAVGPKSSGVTVKTPGVKLATPTQPRVSGITTSTAMFTTSTVPYATVYRWFVAGRLAGTSAGPSWTATRMTSKRKYTVAVQAATAAGAISATSPSASFSTK